MGRFDRLQSLSVKGKTARFELHEAHVPEFCADTPVLLLAHAGRANAEWWNTILAESVASMAEAAGGLKDSDDKEAAAAKFAAERATSVSRDRRLFATVILVGWENLYRDDGTLEEFSAEAAEELLCSETPEGGYLLPDDVFTRIVELASDVSLYRERPSVDPAKLEAALGNSASG